MSEVLTLLQYSYSIYDSVSHIHPVSCILYTPLQLQIYKQIDQYLQDSYKVRNPFCIHTKISLIPVSCYWSVLIMFRCHQRVAAKTPIPQCGSVDEFLGHQNLIFILQNADKVIRHEAYRPCMISLLSHGISIFTKESFATYQICVTCCLHNG